MKRLLFTGFLMVAWARFAFGQAGSAYINNGPFSAPPSTPPQIDATNFVNNSSFTIAFDSYSGLTVSSLNGALLGSTTIPFGFSDVLYYTNRGSLICDTGFTFNTAPSGSGVAHPAAVFGNSNLGSVSAGSATNSSTSAYVFYISSGAPGSGLATGLPQINISATNVYNTGLLDVGLTGIIKVFGNYLDLSRGTVHVEGFDDYATDDYFAGGSTNALIASLLAFSSYNLGIFVNDYGLGLQTNQLSVGSLSPPSVQSGYSYATNIAGLPTLLDVDPVNAAAFAWTNQINQSNFVFQAVFINTNLPGISTAVRFANGGAGISTPVVQWEAIITNNAGVTTQTNFLYLSDVFGSYPTNLFVTNSFSYSEIPEIAPYNYAFYRSYTGYTNNTMAANYVPYAASAFFQNAFPETNAYAAYEVSVKPVSFEPDITALASPVTNLPGRIQIAATNWLDLTKSKITGANYLNVQASNHFNGSANAQIIVPNMDINVGSTNGMLSISNLVAPYVPRFTGIIDMYSARWTNITASGITNNYHVLIVNSSLAATSSVSVLNFAARSTNLVISDILNVSSNLLITAQNLTLTTNGSVAPNPYGEIDFLNPNILWSSSFPILQNVTNWGELVTSNTTYFLGARTSPYYGSNFTQPYLSFVNHGLIVTGGDTIWANYVQNDGTGISNVFQYGGATLASTNDALIYSLDGPISLQASNALLTAGSIVAALGDLTVTTGSLLVSNHVLSANGALTFSITNTLIDGGAASSNFWQAGDGMNLLVKPTTGDFLGTTITLAAPAELEVNDTWAGLDKGASPSGFLNNGAVGHLILNGGDDNSQFYFAGLNATNKYALYVDLLELENGATNRVNENNVETFTAFDFPTNFTIYYADAVIGSSDISEKLNGANGGQLVWVPAYAGIFSSTNLVYPAGHTNTFNRALVESTDIDSNGNGIPNAFDPTPIFTAYYVNFTVSLTNVPPRTPVLSWYALANATNYLYYRTNLTTTNLVVVTNFVQGNNSGYVKVVDAGRTNKMGFYQIQESVVQP